MTATIHTRLLVRELCLACSRSPWSPMCNMCAALTLAEERAKTRERKEGNEDVYPDGTVAWPSNY